jgi:hypothetical protein
MRARALVLIGVLSSGTSMGCGTFWQDAGRNLVEAPIQQVDESCSAARNSRLAARAWDNFQRTNLAYPHSDDYACGFKEGFADYLKEGGSGAPPAVPPFRYRLSWHQNPAGLVAIDEWYAGFHDGAAVARTSGLRDERVVPLSAPPINAVPQFPAGAQQSADAPLVPNLPQPTPLSPGMESEPGEPPSLPPEPIPVAPRAQVR